MSSQLKISTQKIIASRSGNRCAYPGCKALLVTQDSHSSGSHLVGEIAHISGEKKGSARYLPSMTDEERNHHDNLMFLCSNCHTLIDKPGTSITISQLKDWKRAHEVRIQEAVFSAVPDVTFAELEVVCRAVADGAPVNADFDFSVTDVEGKMKKNGMTYRSRNVLRMGLATSRYVAKFVESNAQFSSTFPDRLKAGFQLQYERLYDSGIYGDDLFDELCNFAGRPPPGGPVGMLVHGRPWSQGSGGRRGRP